jgi:hypothetical protein
MNCERFIKPKYDKYIQLYSKKANCEDATQSLVLTGISIGNAGQNYPNTCLTASITAPTTGTQATCTPTVSNGKITGAVLTNAGSGYTSIPQITLNVSPTTSVKAIEIADRGLGYTAPPKIFIDYPPNIRKAVILAKFSFVGEMGEMRLETLQIIDGGAGYTTPPTIIINTSNPVISDIRATATLTLTGGSVSGFTINTRGSYDSPANDANVIVSEHPSVATATCTIDEEGSINSITITNEGSGYTSTPNVVLEQVSYTEQSQLVAHRTVGFNDALSINSRYQPSQVFKYTWDLDTPISINENALLSIVERQFLNIPAGDANKLISIKIHDIGTQSIVNTRNTGINTDFNGGILLDIGKPDRVLSNQIQLEINQQVINRITLSINHDITSSAGFAYSNEFVIVMKVSEKEPSIIEYGALNNINFLQ